MRPLECQDDQKKVSGFVLLWSLCLLVFELRVVVVPMITSPIGSDI